MRALDKKLIRDLVKLRGMVLVIALMIASGAATFIALLSTLDSLRQTQQSYYEDYRFSNVFASLERAPIALREELREIPGVNRILTRIRTGATLEVEGFDETVRASITSLPNDGQPLLNRLHLREGRMPHPYSDREIIIGDGFAEAHGFRAGDEVVAIISGRRRTLRIVGIGLSPEFIYQGQPGSTSPDVLRWGLVWMRREAVAAAADMTGAFNDITLSTTRDADVLEIIARIDRLLEPYGGLGAVAREDQNSHFFITEEFNQLGTIATIIPVIFVGVAAFLLNIVIGRLVRTQREQVAILKAFGYPNSDIAAHYLKLVTLIVVIGLAAGTWLGVVLGRELAELYAGYYRFPYLNFGLNPVVFFLACSISIVAAYSGAYVSVRRAAGLPPAEAMRPESPATYRRTLLERTKLGHWFDQPTRMIIRNLERQRVRVAFSVIGIACAGALVMLGRMSNDSVKFAVEGSFREALPTDLIATFERPVSSRAALELARIDGVRYVESSRAVPVRVRYGHRSYLTAIEGFEQDAKLRVLRDERDFRVSVPRSGILLSSMLSDLLQIDQGDTLAVEFLDGSERTAGIPVVGFIRQYFGLAGYMDIDALSELLVERRAISAAYALVDRSREDEIVAKLSDSPHVAEIISKQKIIERFYESTARTWLIMALFVSLFAAATAFSVVYNNARISLSERSRELASLRVLGFTKREVAYILMGELAVIVVLAIPLGLVLGRALTMILVAALETELYRIPMNISPATYALSATVLILAGLLSSLVVGRRVGQLDMISVLKTRE